MAEPVILSQANQLAIANARHGHTAQRVDLVQANTLIVNGTIHAHAAQSPNVTGFLMLQVQNTLHLHFAQKVDLLQAGALGVQDAYHTHMADELLLLQGGYLTVAGAYHSHTATHIELDTRVVLLPADCWHGHTADHIELRPQRLVEFLAAAGETFMARLFDVTSSVVVSDSASVAASANRQMMYRAVFDEAPENLYQLVVYGTNGKPVALWYVMIKNTSVIQRSGNYADIIMAESLEILKSITLNKTVTNPYDGIMTVYKADDVTPMLTTQMYEDAAETKKYRGRGAEVRGKLT